MKRIAIERYLYLVLCWSLSVAVLSGCASSNQTQKADDDEEEVSIGYGKQKKRDVTGAVSTVTSDDVDQQPVRSVEEMLKGRVSGVSGDAGTRRWHRCADPGGLFV